MFSENKAAITISHLITPCCYALASGQTFYMPKTMGHCSCCDKNVAIEDLPRCKQMLTRTIFINKLSCAAFYLPALFIPQSKKRHQELEKRVAALEEFQLKINQRTTPKCLGCGAPAEDLISHLLNSTDPLLEFKNPSGYPVKDLRFYSPDGLFLQRTRLCT